VTYYGCGKAGLPNEEREKRSLSISILRKQLFIDRLGVI
jgi:hypothetical protein